MRIVTQGLTETQQLEAVMKAARVDERRARTMLEEQCWDAVVIDGNVLVGKPLVGVAPPRRAPNSASAGELVSLTASAFYGEIEARGASPGTIFVEPTGVRRELVES
jgi:hypothetical protein